MREKLLNLMKNEGLTSSRLAEILEIQPSGVSHILAGRNKPGFDLLQKILRRFPRINPDWLLLDSEQMYRDNMEASPSMSLRDDTLFTEPSVVALQSTSPAQSTPSLTASATAQSATPDTSPAEHLRQLRSTATNAEVVRVVVFYADQTCESFSTRK